MERKKAKKDLNFYLGAAVGVLIIGLVVLCATLEKGPKTRIWASDMLTELDGWTAEYVGEVEFPYSIIGKTGETVWFSNTLPDELPDHYGMTMRGYFCKVEVTVNDKTIYTFGDKRTLPFGCFTGNIRLVIPIDKSYAGQRMVVYVTPIYTQHIDFSEPKFGFIGDINMTIVYENLFRIIVGVFMLTIFVLSMGLAVFQSFEKSLLNKRLIGFFAMFVFTVMGWFVCSSDVPQFFSDNNGTVALISYLSLAIMAIPYAGFCECLLPDSKKIMRVLRAIGGFIAITNVFGFVTNFFDPPQILFLSHVYILTVSGVSIFFALKARKRGRDAKLLLFCFAELVFFVVLGFLCYFLAPSSGYDGIVFGIGLMLFVFALFGVILYRQVKSIEERKRVEIYKGLAYSDMLTGLGNRTGFDREFERLHEHTPKGTLVTLVMFDLNHLKVINDSFGHQAGDDYIMAMADCLKKVFGRFGNCFRYGGDEFAVVMVNQGGRAEELVKEFEEELRQFNMRTDNKLSASVGYAELEWNGSEDFEKELFEMADEKLYSDKKLYHEQKKGEFYI